MISIWIDDSIVEYAQKKLSYVETTGELGLSKFGSERDRILAGYIGEKIIMEVLKIKEDADNYDFDLISNKGKKLEVKTITCKSQPLPEYLCTVNSHNLNGVHKQKADYYIFLRILNDFSQGWILGWISCSDFFKYGEYKEKGTDFGEFQFEKANATVLEISEINKFKYKIVKR